ncbi:unnamed protein product [Prorocentrum cordatum]|uniref:EF-hand domain-containing protein n=1 Tax=Prorocentrum cordatum TaxID=2364126 RepID=A0ABN9WX01_9DINO|nr:unnamed protein product [Polarella glacialis]
MAASSLGAAFEAIDTDGDGKVSREEFRAAVQRGAVATGLLYAAPGAAPQMVMEPVAALQQAAAEPVQAHHAPAEVIRTITTVAPPVYVAPRAAQAAEPAPAPVEPVGAPVAAAPRRPRSRRGRPWSPCRRRPRPWSPWARPRWRRPCT